MTWTGTFTTWYVYSVGFGWRGMLKNTSQPYTENYEQDIAILFHSYFWWLLRVQSNPVYMDTEGSIESVHIKGVEFRENIRAFFPQGQRELSVIMKCLY